MSEKKINYYLPLKHRQRTGMKTIWQKVVQLFSSSLNETEQQREKSVFVIHGNCMSRIYLWLFGYLCDGPSSMVIFAPANRLEIYGKNGRII